MHIRGQEIVADRSGALYWPGERMLVVADLHLEKGSAFAVRGRMLPPYDTRETLSRLGEVIGRYRPRCVVALGDSFHDRRAGERLGTNDLRDLAELQAGREWIWITGNHDPEISGRAGGCVQPSLTLGNIVFRHEPVPGPVEGEIAGHLHPAARVHLGGAGLRRPCFVASPSRIVLPAFGAFAGGLNVLDEAFMPLFEREGGTFDVHVLGRDGVYPVARSSLGPD
jgi:DNA ligase-associated metallophosphoesterase